MTTRATASKVNATNGSSFGMAVTTAVALLCYALILFLPRRAGSLPE